MGTIPWWYFCLKVHSRSDFEKGALTTFIKETCAHYKQAYCQYVMAFSESEMHVSVIMESDQVELVAEGLLLQAVYMRYKLRELTEGIFGVLLCHQDLLGSCDNPI